MPTSVQVLEGLTRISREYVGLAVAWHLAFGLLLAALAAGRRPSPRVWAALLSAPLFSVAALAALGGNPFNGSVFLITAVGTLIPGLRRDGETTVLSGRSLRWFAGLMMAFGWAYPHFLEDTPGVRSLWAAPLGLIPCPTLSMVTGLVLLAKNAVPPPAALLIGVSGLLYGVLGWLWLGVAWDVALLAGAAVLLSRTATAIFRAKRGF